MCAVTRVVFHSFIKECKFSGSFVFNPLQPWTLESCRHSRLSGLRRLNRGNCCTPKFTFLLRLMFHHKHHIAFIHCDKIKVFWFSSLLQALRVGCVDNQCKWGPHSLNPWIFQATRVSYVLRYLIHLIESSEDWRLYWFWSESHFYWSSVKIRVLSNWNDWGLYEPNFWSTIFSLSFEATLFKRSLKISNGIRVLKLG